MKLKRHFFVLIILFFTVSGIMAQKQVSDYFNQINDTYKGVKDYKAVISITTGGLTQKGTMWVKGSDVYIEFSNPKQIISIRNGKLTVYDSADYVVLEQEMSSINAGTVEGLQLLRKYYKYSYYDEAGYKLVPLEDGSNERVVKLNFQAKSGSLEYRKMTISFSKNNLMRRIEGTTFGGVRIVFDFTTIKTNIGIPSQKFDYEAPGVASTIPNFIFTPE